MVEVVINDAGVLTLRIVYPAPRGLISHFRSSATPDHRLGMAAYDSPSLRKILTTTHLPRVFMDVNVGLVVKVLDLVDPWL